MTILLTLAFTIDVTLSPELNTWLSWKLLHLLLPSH